MMSNNPRDMVQTSHSGSQTARSMPDAADENTSFAAINGLSDESDIAVRAYELFVERSGRGEAGSADDDWLRAENEVRRSLSGNSPSAMPMTASRVSKAGRR